MHPLRLALFLALLTVFAGCEQTPPPAPLTAVHPTREPLIRVRIAHELTSIHFEAPRSLHVHTRQNPDQPQRLSSPLEIRREAGRWITPWQDHALPEQSTLVIRGLGPDPIEIDGRTFPGHIELVPLTEGGFDAVNHTPLEAYLPGVLKRELPDRWSPATYLAQAIAARSYALDRMITLGIGRHYDVVDSQASQAYAGITTHRLAQRAVADTTGMVLTWRSRILPAYYASTCGGVGQSAYDAFGINRDTEPLIPHQNDPFCLNTKHARPTTFTRNRALLSQRIAAWGKARNLPIAELGLLQSIETQRKNNLDRPVRFMLADTAGHAYSLSAESLRLACNYSPDGIQAPPKGTRLGTSLFHVSIDEDLVRFEDVRGLGHGVGLCQYGAEGMARAGHDALDILGRYYPGVHLERAY